MRAVHILERALGEDENGAGMLGAAQNLPYVRPFLTFFVPQDFLSYFLQFERLGIWWFAYHYERLPYDLSAPT